MAAAESLTEVPQVGWPNHDVNAPNYAHLETPPRGNSFSLTPDDLELLIQANHFAPQGHDGTIVVGLRGAELTAGHQVEDAASLDLRDVRPNHLTFCCVLGFYDRDNRRLSAYTGSTVPNALSMTRYFKWQNGLGSESWANMPPTGCYAFRRASHGWDRTREQWKVPVALRLTRPGMNGDGTATVLRTKNDFTDGTKDFWHTSVPTDNIHPAFSTTAFSSAGCLTVRGSSERFTNNATEQWQRFLSRIHQQIPLNGRIDLLLLTGAEGAIAATMRHGTAGDAAAVEGALGRLQSFLGITADGAFGPGTKASLTRSIKRSNPLTRPTASTRPARTRCSGSISLVPEPDDGGQTQETEMDLKDFIANTELAAVPAGISADASPESAEDDLQAAVDAGSVLGFVGGLSAARTRTMSCFLPSLRSGRQAPSRTVSWKFRNGTMSSGWKRWVRLCRSSVSTISISTSGN